MVRSALRGLWAEPRVPDPPRRVWRDWALVAVLVPAALLEGAFRDDVVWRPISVLLAVALAPTLLWRRTHPLAAAVTAFGAVSVLSAASIVGSAGPWGLYTTIYLFMLLPYALSRWGSGRQVVVGLGLLVLTAGLGLVADWTGAAEAVLGLLFLLFPVVLGGFVRTWTTGHARQLDQVKLREREQLARELHDTVAHHVSAIVVRAQAGRVVAADRPAAAVEALDVIEAEASRALTEMRLMVGSLRGGEEPQLAPQRGVADLEGLARASGDAPRVEVELAGDLDDLRPSVGAAVYRLAQESITNAARHARNATRIAVRVTGDDDSVRLTVADDGDPGSTGRDPSGYGLVGMTERATLLGGTLEAGPGPERGWTVEAVLPRTGTSR